MRRFLVVLALSGLGASALLAGVATAGRVPAPPAIFALPAGTVGHTPIFWIGATAGASLSFL